MMWPSDKTRTPDHYERPLRRAGVIARGNAGIACLAWLRFGALPGVGRPAASAAAPPRQRTGGSAPSERRGHGNDRVELADRTAALYRVWKLEQRASYKCWH